MQAEKTVGVRRASHTGDFAERENFFDARASCGQTVHSLGGDAQDAFRWLVLSTTYFRHLRRILAAKKKDNAWMTRKVSRDRLPTVVLCS